MRSTYDTDLWRHRAEMRRQGKTIQEIAVSEGIKAASISKGFQRMRYLGFDVPRDSGKGGRPAEVRVIGVEPDTYDAVRQMAMRHGMTASKAVRLILKTAVVDHPQIAANILDPEA